MGELPRAGKSKKRYGNRRFLGKPHAIRVSENPLHYTSKLEDLQQCYGCEQLFHKSAFVRPSGATVTRCPKCLEEILK